MLPIPWAGLKAHHQSEFTETTSERVEIENDSTFGEQVSVSTVGLDEEG